MANISANLRPYTPQDFPSLLASRDTFLAGELQRVSASLAAAIAVIKALDAKQVAHGW